MNDSEPYEMARALDSNDDLPIGELTESDVEMLRRIFGTSLGFCMRGYSGRTLSSRMS